MTARLTVPPIIETPRLRLRPMCADDADALLGVFGDSRVMASFDAAPFDATAMARWVARNLAHQARHGYGLFTVLCKTDGAVIGDCGLEWVDFDGVPAAELGYDLRYDQWGRGLATEAAAAVRAVAFGPLALPRLVSLIRAGNPASARVAAKIGMRPLRAVTRGATDYTLYGISRDDLPPPKE